MIRNKCQLAKVKKKYSKGRNKIIVLRNENTNVYIDTKNRLIIELCNEVAIVKNNKQNDIHRTQRNQKLEGFIWKKKILKSFPLASRINRRYEEVIESRIGQFPYILIFCGIRILSFYNILKSIFKALTVVEMPKSRIFK